MTFPEYFTEAVFRVSFLGAALHVFQAFAPAHIWWNNTVIHPSGIFISGKAQPCYEIQLNSHFCHINGSHFFHHFCFFIAGCSFSPLAIRDAVLTETYTVAESPPSLKSTLQRQQGSQGHSALIRNTHYTSLVKAAMHSGSGELTKDTFLLSPSISRYIYIYTYRCIYTHTYSSAMAQKNSRVTSNPSTYEGQNATEMQNLSSSFWDASMQPAKSNPGEPAAKVHRVEIIFCFILPLSRGWM